MSEVEQNPYAAGSFRPESKIGQTKRPVGLLVLCVLIITFASIGFLGSTFAAIMLAVNGGKINYQQQMGANADMDINPEAVKKLEAFGPSHSSKNMLITFAGLFVSAVLILGSIGAIYPLSWGRFVLTFGCGMAVLFVIAQGAVVMIMFQDILSVLKEYPDNFYIPKGDMDERALDMMSTIIRTSYAIIPIVTWVLSAVKAIFYISVMAYLRKRNVREFILGTAG